jgi:hypothetical protein
LKWQIKYIIPKFNQRVELSNKARGGEMTDEQLDELTDEQVAELTYLDFMDDPYVLEAPRGDQELLAVRMLLSVQTSRMTPEEEIAYYQKVMEEERRMRQEVKGMTEDEMRAYFRKRCEKEG